ncbi:ABC transporter substrate-binding protein [Nonomuraea roseoviolacea]|uniref:Peptide/nickel transport system substrate-binding protein n=1 Tax=Nonomuraea roseoviolacea subsp. carminata TaxID=160689 RepID=A0ABT1JT86_9ACTN|nr:ABC transporter substrate-binding protein [Nonomuraea roseoviolacea]MCP2343999.1 peptide/nickel transport system substrate-binding protein [Nonomuraea roseoviolacea subsp. carminata]
MKRGWAALAGAALLTLTACSTPTQSTAARAQDTVVLGLGSEPDTLSPVLGYAPDGGSLMYDGLVRRTPDLKLQPALAQALPQIKGTQVTFTLRQGVTFHNGKPLTGADVAYTYTKLLDPAGNSPIRGDYAAIEKVEAPDARTVVFRLKYPYAAILQRATLGIVPDGSDLKSDPVGTGPYRFASWAKGDKITLKANDRYWGAKPAIKTLVLAYTADDNSRATRMAAGEFTATELPPKAVGRFRNQPGVTVYEAPSADYRGVMFPLEQPVTGDLAVREALNLAVDRGAMVSAILAGAGSPAYGPVAPGTDWHNAAVDGSSAPDRTKAAEVLESAGWKVGGDGIRAKEGTPARFTLMYPAGDALRKELALAFASDAKRIGIDVRLAGLDWDAIYPRMAKDALIMGWGSPYDPDYVNYELFHSSYIGQGSFNPGRYKVPEVDKLLDAGRRTTDPAARKKVYDAFQQRVSDDQVWVYLVYLKHTYVVRGDWSGITVGVEAHEHATGGLFNTVPEWKPAS